MVTASAPVYVVWIWIGGGMIDGNWAIGSPVIATRPRTTVTMAMTIATMGLSTKKRDMESAGRGRTARRRRRAGLERLDREGHPGLHVLQARHDDGLARLQTLVDDPEFSGVLAGLDRSDLGFPV